MYLFSAALSRHLLPPSYLSLVSPLLHMYSGLHLARSYPSYPAVLYVFLENAWVMRLFFTCCSLHTGQKPWPALLLWKMTKKTQGYQVFRVRLCTSTCSKKQSGRSLLHVCCTSSLTCRVNCSCSCWSVCPLHLLWGSQSIVTDLFANQFVLPLPSISHC